MSQEEMKKVGYSEEIDYWMENCDKKDLTKKRNSKKDKR